MKKFFFIFIASVFSMSCYSQLRKVNGYVMDSKNRPLSYVNINIYDTQRNSTSDENGYFEILAPQSSFFIKAEKQGKIVYNKINIDQSKINIIFNKESIKLNTQIIEQNKQYVIDNTQMDTLYLNEGLKELAKMKSNLNQLQIGSYSENQFFADKWFDLNIAEVGCGPIAYNSEDGYTKITFGYCTYCMIFPTSLPNSLGLVEFFVENSVPGTKLDFNSNYEPFSYIKILCVLNFEKGILKSINWY